jgi:hypothetical protein
MTPCVIDVAGRPASFQICDAGHVHIVIENTGPLPFASLNTGSRFIMDPDMHQWVEDMQRCTEKSR